MLMFQGLRDTKVIDKIVKVAEAISNVIQVTHFLQIKSEREKEREREGETER